MQEYKIFVRGRLDTATEEYPIIGALDRYTSFEAIIRSNGVGSFTLTVPDGSTQAKLLTGYVDPILGSIGGPGSGIVVVPKDSQLPIFSGPIRNIKRIWDTNNSGLGTIEVTGVDDNEVLQSRLAWPAPNQTILNQHFAASWAPQFEGALPANAAETITALLRDNVVSPAQPSRRVPGVVIPATPQGQMDDDNSAKGLRLRFAPMDEVVNGLADIYDVKVRFLWVPEFDDNGTIHRNKIVGFVSPIEDKSASVIFSEQFGNLKGFEYSFSAPKSTRQIIGAQGQGQYRWFNEYRLGEDDTFVDPFGRTPTEAEWGVSKESYKDRRDIAWEANSGYTKDKRTYTLLIDGSTKGPFDVTDPKTGEVIYISRWRPGSGAVAPRVNGPYKIPTAGTKEDEQLQTEVQDFALANAATGMIKTDVIDTPNMKFLEDYDIGDVVQLNVDGQARTEKIREIRMTIKVNEVFKIGLTVGSETASETPFLYREIRKLWSAVYGNSSLEDLDIDPFGKIVPDPPTISAPSFSLTGNLMTVTGTTRSPIPGEVPVVTVERRTDGGSWVTMAATEIDSPDGDNSSWTYSVNYTPASTTGTSDIVEWRAKVDYPVSGLETTTSAYSYIVKTTIGDDPNGPEPINVYSPKITTPNTGDTRDQYTTKSPGQTLTIKGKDYQKWYHLAAIPEPNPSTTAFTRIRVYKTEYSGSGPYDPIRGAFIKEVRANSAGDWTLSFTLTSGHYNYANSGIEDGERALFWVEAHALNGVSHHSFVTAEKP